MGTIVIGAMAWLAGVCCGVWLSVVAYRLGYEGGPWKTKPRHYSCANGSSCYAPGGCADPASRRAGREQE